MKILPKGNMYFGRYRDAQLTSAAQSLHDGLVAEAVTFPTPPITVIAFQVFIDDYKTAAAAAVKGTKVDTINKKDAKNDLMNNMRSMVQYVNQVVYDTYEATPSMNYAALRALILSAGVKDLQDLKHPAPKGNARMPVTINDKKQRAAGTNGVLSIRVKATRKYNSKSVKQYWVKYRKVATPVNEWSDYQATSTLIDIVLPGGINGLFEYQIAAVTGIFRGQDQLNWSNIQETVVT
jgi:hypothetical protein